MRQGFLTGLVLAACVAGACPAAAATLQETFHQGVEAFQAGRFDEAVDLFRTLHDRFDVRSPDVLVDLGAAEFQAGRPGVALLHFHEAALAAPGSPAGETARVNIERVRAALNQRQGQTARGGFVFGPVSDAWTAMYGWAAPRWALATFLVLWCGLFVGLSAWRLARPGRGRQILWGVCVAAAVLAAVSGTVAYGSQRVASYRVGVLLGDNTALYDTLDSVDKALVLPEGLEVRVAEVRGGFARVRLSSGREGYIAEGAVGIPM